MIHDLHISVQVAFRGGVPIVADENPMIRTMLRDILTPGIIGVSASSTMGEALQRMRAERISSVVALRRGRPVGILTERGVIAAVAEHGQDLLRRTVAEVMSSPVESAPEDMPILLAFGRLSEKGIRHLVVVDGKGRAKGMVTQTNMIQSLGVEYFVDVKRVGQIMTRRVASLRGLDTLSHALRLMAEGPFSCVVILEDGKPAGIFTERDMVRLVAEQRPLGAIPLLEVMTRPVLTISLETPVHHAAAMMRDNVVRRLVVVDGQGAVQGLLTQSDIVMGMEARSVEMLREVIREKDDLLREAVGKVAKKTAYLDTILNSALDMGIAATDNGEIAFVNQVAQDILEMDGPAAIGQDLMEFHRMIGVSPRRVKKALATITRETIHKFAIAKSASGAKQHIEGRVSGIWEEGSKPAGFVLMVRDVTERRLAEETIKRMAYHDALTGLPNRFLVADRLEVGLAAAKRKQAMLAVMLLDLDGFKQVNDCLGHNVGDMLLRQVAERLSAVLRKSDTVGRMGGDEFLIVLPDVHDLKEVEAVAEKILRTVAEPRHIAGHGLRVTTSLGVSLFPRDGDEAQTLIKKADVAMYVAKNAGRSTYRFAQEGQGHDACDLFNPA